MPDAPSGTVTFLFTDIEGSTQLWERFPDAMMMALTRHDAIVRHAIELNGGRIFKTVGDSFYAAFSTAAGAVAAALAAQRALFGEAWDGISPLRVRMALHSGMAEQRHDDYFGLPVNRVARIMSIGHGGQILLSLATTELVRDHLPDGVSLLELGERRLKDLIRPERIFQLVVPGLPSQFPPLKSLDILPNNLPRQLTSFIGREHEIAEVKRLLTPLLKDEGGRLKDEGGRLKDETSQVRVLHPSSFSLHPSKEARLVTLTGPGGAGKTRLSLQVAADVLDYFIDGVWFVELAPLSDAASVPQALASALGLREEPGRPLLNTLTDYLRPKKLLVILDNCEHLVTACAQLAQTLLQRCERLHILATSREAFGIPGETIFRVPSLSLPSKGGLQPETGDLASVLSQYEAVRLFIDRAVAVLPNFTVTNQNAPAVAQICQRLDGIPLAIELAAARVQMFSVEQIASRLDDRFRLLTGGSRTALPRQQTLRALIDWGYDLLSVDERVLLRRLSVFAGGWTLEAAEAVCGDKDEGGRMPASGILPMKDEPKESSAFHPSSRASHVLHPSDVLDLLAGLVNKSLVVVGEEGNLRTAPSEGRAGHYRLLETIRAHAREKLLIAGEMEPVRNCHLEFFTRLAEQAEPRLYGAEQARWLDQLEAEHDNLRAALEWSVSGGAVENGLQLTGALWWFWYVRGYLNVGRDWLERILSQPVVDHRSPLAPMRVKALNGAGVLAWVQRDTERAASLSAEGLALSRALGDRLGMAYSLNLLGSVARYQDHYERAIALYEESLALFQAVGHKWGIAFSLDQLGGMALLRGDYHQAAQLTQESLALRRELGDKLGITQSLSALGLVAESERNDARAAALYEECLLLRRELGFRLGIAYVLSRLGLIAQHQGDYEQATAHHEESLMLSRELGHTWGIATALYHLAMLARLRDDRQRALMLCRESLSLRKEIGDRQAVAESMAGLGLIALAQGQAERSVRLLAVAAAQRDAIGVPLLPAEREEQQRTLDTARNQLAHTTFETAWTEGRAMSLEEAIAYVKEESSDLSA